MTTKQKLQEMVLTIQNHYITHLEELDYDKKIHWLTRHYLWFGDSFSLDFLIKEEKTFFKKTLLGTRRFYSSFYKQKLKGTSPLFRGNDLVRKKKKEEYPTLYRINRILFKGLFTKTIFKKDVRSLFPFIVSRE